MHACICRIEQFMCMWLSYACARRYEVCCGPWAQFGSQLHALQLQHVFCTTTRSQQKCQPDCMCRQPKFLAFGKPSRGQSKLIWKPSRRAL